MVIEALIAAGADRGDGPALPRQLAQHADHRADDPAVDPGLDHRALRARRDAEPDDAGRAGAVGRHPGRPGDRDDREHRAPPAHRQAARRGDHGRRRRDRRAGVRLDAVHLHRLRADVLPLRRRALPVRAAGRGGGVRDDRVLHPVAHPGADAGDAADARPHGQGAPRRARGRARCSASTARSTAASSACAPATPRCSRRCSPSAARSRLSFLAFCLLSCGLYPVLGRDFFPTRRRRPDPPALPRRRPAPGSRRRRASPTTSRRRSASSIPKDQLETILDNLGVPNSGINLSYSNSGTIGTLDGEILMSLRKGHRPTEEFVTILLRASCRSAFPGIEFFFQPADIVTQILNFGLPAAIDVQFTGNAMAAQRRARRRAGEEDPADPGRRRRAPAPALRRARGQPADGPHPAAADGPVGAERRPERAGVARPAARRRRRRSGSTRRTASSTRSRCRRRSTSVDSLDALLNMPVAGTGGAATATQTPAPRQPGRGDAGAHSRRSCRATTSRPRSTSTRACRAPTWRASRPRCRRWSTRSGRSCRAAAR